LGRYTLKVSHRRFHEYVLENFYIQTNDVSYQAQLNPYIITQINHPSEIMIGNFKPIVINISRGDSYYYPDRCVLEIFVRKSLGDYLDWEFYVNDIPLNPVYKGLKNFHEDGEYYTWERYINLYRGSNYTFRFQNVHSSISIEEELEITIPQKMIVSWPQMANDEDKHIAWTFENNNDIDPDFIEFFVFAKQFQALDLFTDYEMLLPSQREYILLEDTIPITHRWRINLHFTITNYDISERASIRYSETWKRDY